MIGTRGEKGLTWARVSNRAVLPALNWPRMRRRGRQRRCPGFSATLARPSMSLGVSVWQPEGHSWLTMLSQCFFSSSSASVGAVEGR